MNNNALYRLWHYRERVGIATGVLCMASSIALLTGCALISRDYAAASYGYGVATGCLMGASTLLVLDSLDRNNR